jgi:uncharacterized protein YjbI with pentapeptide repeats
MAKKAASVLRARWADGYFAQAEASLRQLLVTHDGVFRHTVDLRGVKLPDDKNHPAEYWFTHAAGVDIKNVDLSYAILAVSLRGSRLTHVILDDATLDRVNLDRAVLVDCSFRNAKILAKMDDTEFRGCDFTGALLGATSSLKEFGGRRTKFVACSFEGTHFRRVEFRASRFENCTFDGARFEASDFRGARFSGNSPQPHQFDASCQTSPTTSSESTVA